MEQFGAFRLLVEFHAVTLWFRSVPNGVKHRSHVLGYSWKETIDTGVCVFAVIVA